MTEPTIFRTLVADPPWKFDDKLPGPKRGAEKHYATMPTEAICTLRLPLLASDALLFLWRVASMQDDALEVCHAWGFKPVSEIVWCKTGADGKPRIGMGRYVRNAHETCLVGARPGAASLIQDRGVPSWFCAPRGRHSAKPRAFFDLVEKLAPGPRVELFAREEREGWTCLGDELGAPLAFGLFAREVGFGESEEVARLAAAAPELVRALLRVEDDCKACPSLRFGEHTAGCPIDAALTKAGLATKAERDDARVALFMPRRFG